MRLLPLHVQSYLMVAFPLWAIYEWVLPWLCTQPEVDHAFPPLRMAFVALLATVVYFVVIIRVICYFNGEDFDLFE